MSKPVLYSFYMSSASWRVRIALAYKKIQYDYKAVNILRGGQQHAEEYQGINPMRQVPTLVIDGVALTQSLPIIEYLEETRPENRLLPKDSVDRAHVRRIAEIVNSGIQPNQNSSVINMIEEWTGDRAKKVAWPNYWIDRGFKGLEKVLETTSGQYCVGDNVTMADLCLVPQIYGAIKYKVDMTKYPIIQRIHDNCIKLNEFQVADPSQQPDCPDDKKNRGLFSCLKPRTD